VHDIDGPANSGSTLWLIVLSALVAVVAGYLSFVIAFGGESGTIKFDIVGLGITVGIIAVVLVVHEGIHGLAFLAFGGRPTFGAGLAGKVLPYFYCTSVGQRFSVAQYLVIHLAGCIGDWFLVFRVLRAPRGSLVEDMKDGLIIYKPAT